MGTFSGKYPPNSLEAIRDAIEGGASRVEIDVRFMADDGMLVYHDATIDGDTDGFGAVEALTRERVPRIRFSSDERISIAMVEDIVDAVRGTDVVLQVDLKQMRPLTDARVNALAGALAPLGEQALIGSMAHWNVRRLTGRGFSLAIDPSLQWNNLADQHSPLLPSRRGLHGLWDNAPLAVVPGVAGTDYVRERIADINTLVPGCVEWMVDIATLEAIATLGVALGDELHARGVGLAAWTVRDDGPDVTGPLTWRLISLGANAIITDHPRELAGYIAARENLIPG